jgi:gallate dioxygenase
MATIIGGIAASHTPTIGFAFDGNKQHDPVWAPIFEAFMPVRQWVKDKAPDVLFVIYNDHVTSFFFDHYSPFVLGVDNHYPVADEGGGARDLPPLQGHLGLSRHVAQSLVADEFDLSVFRDKALDHGAFSPLSMLCERTPDWPCQVVPLQVGVLQFPVPSAKRCYKLGQALKKAIESYPEDLKVAIVATGGLSHQVHGERCGFNNTEWDHAFLELLENDPARLAELTLAEYAELGGMEGAEVIMWLIMRGALSANVRKVHQAYHLPSMTGIATAIYENHSKSSAVAAEHSRHLAHVGTQLAGAENLTGTYPFDLARSHAGYQLNKFLHDLIHPAKREAFRNDELGTMLAAGLSDTERAMVIARDWQALIRFGVSFFMLEKLAAVVGSTNLHVYAAMRGQPLEEFLQTRNAPSALYSVARQEPAHAGVAETAEAR